MNLSFTKSLIYIGLVFCAITILSVLLYVIPSTKLVIDNIEAQSFDIRQRVLDKWIKKTTIEDSNVAVIVIDDDSLDVLSKKYGSWPWNRSAYADIINYLENDGADLIFLDFMFLGHQQGNEKNDKKLIDAVTKNRNVYIAMNFDYRRNENSPELPLVLASNLDNKSDITFDNFNFSNLRGTMDELFKGTNNIGFINFARDDDGMSRRVPSFFVYKERYYPYISMKLIQEYYLKHKIIQSRKFIINQNRQVVMGDKKIQLDEEGFMILNWFANRDIYEVPFWEVIEGKFDRGYFKDKIVCIGASANSLGDIKSTPLSQYYPGVKITATYLNNIFNDTEIKKMSADKNILITLGMILCLIVALIWIRSNWISGVIAIAFAFGYFLFTTIAMGKDYLWIDCAYPLFLILITFTVVYILKFIKKSKDFERTYKLATTDGLTGLFNHRYFQEQMQANIYNSNRYENNFSLVLIDIDFFKKFNDTFGHQAGDEVLRTVAKILKKYVRASDVVCRYGGEEMTIILTNTNYEAAKAAAQKICDSVSSTTFTLIDNIDCNVTISLGVSTYPEHGKTPAELIEYADKCLYKAKENGRNQVGNYIIDNEEANEN